MNPTLPTSRDLPPLARTRIRAELERVVTRRPRRVWLVPTLSAAAAAGFLLVALLALPSKPHDGDGPPAVPMSEAPPATAGAGSPPISTAPMPPGERPSSAIPGVSADRRDEIQRNCAAADGKPRAVLYRLIEDEAGRTALLYTPDGYAIECRMGVPASPYGVTGSTSMPLDWLPGPVSLDVHSAYPGDGIAAGLQTAAGRITSDVARVTYTIGGRTADAVIANGTYVARILHPRDWQSPDSPEDGVVRAYDAHGELLATVYERDYYRTCYRAPGGALLPYGTGADPNTCREAVPWR